MIEVLRKDGWLRLSRSDDFAEISLLIAEIEEDTPLMRDIEIASSGSRAQLQASREQFDFHTDGVFWQVPPRWMCIEVLRADFGGALHVVDLRPLSEVLDAFGPVFFGNGNGGLVARAVENHDGSQVLRYRQDYMHSVNDAEGVNWGGLHLTAAHHMHRRAHRVGELRANECLFLDNWHFAHFRAAFSGERVIRRLWFGGVSHR
ncbi:hypothetical protein AB7M16_003006 [Bradyrhizobium sp. USDA 372]